MIKKLLFLVIALVLMAGTAGATSHSHYSTQKSSVSDPYAGLKPAAFSVKCQWTGQQEQIDPIVFPGQMSPHMHNFFGAPNITSTTTSADLRNAPSSTCTPIPSPSGDGTFLPDNSAYWQPQLYKTPEKISGPHPAIHVYYRSDGVDPRPGVDPTTVLSYPQDLAYVAGNSRAMVPGDNPHAYWSCVSAHQTQADHFPTIPDKCPANYPDNYISQLRAIVAFPSCYDGGGSGTNYTSHLTYPVDNPYFPLVRDSYPLACPAGYYSIPEIDMVFRWPLGSFPLNDNGTPTDPSDDYRDLTGATLASDNMDMGGGMMTGGHGVTMHADAMEGFTQDEVNQLIGQCYHAPDGPRDCGVIIGGGEN